jgi:hypothetical protein
MIKVIERFAPREYESEREIHYYNYEIISLYLKPLVNLLKTISQRNRYLDDQDRFACELFLRLKAFYDPKDRLSLDEAKKDANLLRRFRDLFTIFYGRKDLSGQDIRDLIRNI